MEALAAEHGVPVLRLGPTGGADLEFSGLFTLPLAELRRVNLAPLRDRFAA